MNSDEAYCLDIFDKFCTANTFYSIVTHFHKLCSLAHVESTNFADFFPKLKVKLPSLDVQQFLAIYDKKTNNPSYQNGTICRDAKVLIIGGGPAGLRCAIECQLLGAKVVLIEKRDIFSRNNVLHIWPFVINDLKGLGAKRFYPKFCAGSINHISINQLQNILLKVALLLGVEVHGGIGFDKLVEQNGSWRISCKIDEESDFEEISRVESQHFDVIIGANGRQCSLPGFKRKALRAKLAIAITANFVNHHTAAEAQVDEISGVSFIFKQSFFQELYDRTGIDLENIVYYKDETHYFIMTAKKSSLLMKGVLEQDLADTDELLHSNNVNKIALKSYILETVAFATENKLTNLEFSLNYRGEPDVSLFDFTSMYASENASKILERNGNRLLLGLIGDSLLEPFWPMGTGCARGFLSALDAAWMVRSWSIGNSPLDIISERESIFKLLAQTTQENLNRNYGNYSVDPHSRYQNINLHFGQPYPVQILELYDTGSNASLNGHQPVVIASPKPVHKGKSSFNHDGGFVQAEAISKNRNIGQDVNRTNTAYGCGQAEQDLETMIMPDRIDFLMKWMQDIVNPFGIEVHGIHDLFVRGDALCGLIHLFRPDLIPQYPFPSDVEEGIELMDAAAFRNQLAFDFLEKEYGIHCAESGLNSTLYSFSNVPVLVDFLSQLYKVFKDESPKLTFPTYPWQKKALRDQSVVGKVQSIQRSFTLPSIDMKYKRENIFNKPPVSDNIRFSRPYFTNESTENTSGMYNQSGKIPVFDDRERERMKRFTEAENTRTNALKFVNSLREKKAEERKVRQAAQKEATKKAIQSLDKPVPCSPINVSTLVNDDFFNEYNMRLWRKSVPTIQERSQKLENNLLESSGLKKKAGASNSTGTGLVERKYSQVGRLNEQAISIMQQKFAETKGCTDAESVHLQPNSGCNGGGTELKKNVRTPSPETAHDYVPVPPYTSTSFATLTNGRPLNEIQPTRTMFTGTNKRDGEILATSKLRSQGAEFVSPEESNDDDEYCYDHESDSPEEFDDDTLNDLSPGELNEILNWSGKYL